MDNIDKTEEEKKLLKSDNPVGVIMGEIGCGKTTLFNNLCNTKLEAGWSATSLTRGLFIRNTACGENDLTLIDTPGTGSN
jgi:predicted GTPase